MAKLNLKQEFDRWKSQNNLHGRHAFSKFIMLKFLDAIQAVSDDFVFKGGNLLWHYIKTPRETTDLDLSTLHIKSHQELRDVLEKTLTYYEEIKFSVEKFQHIGGRLEVGAGVVIGFETAAGQKNQFDIDVVYAVPTDLSKVKSTISEIIYEAASIENIIVDKISASHRFGGGNTRMKDFDDLWRISQLLRSTPNCSKFLTSFHV